MLLHIPGVLSQAEVTHCRVTLENAAWIDGNATAGEQAALAKHNLQIPEDSETARALGDIILRALGRSALFTSAALPLRVLPPMFNRYDTGMKFADHVDGAVRGMGPSGLRMRADISSTLFLTDPEDYDGGELVIRDTYGDHEVKLPAGDMILYPASSLHSVTEITRGARWSSFFWTQSMVRDTGQRALLFDLDMAIVQTRQALGDESPAVLSLTNTYHNLLRRWIEM